MLTTPSPEIAQKRQSSQIRKLALALRSSYRRNKSWRMTAKEHHILTPTAEVNPGLAKRIAKDKYQPSPTTIKRLEYDGAIEPKKPRSIHKMISDITEAELKSALENRTDMPEADPRIIKAFARLGWLEKIETLEVPA